MTNAAKRQIKNRLNVVLKDLHEWKNLRNNGNYATFSKSMVALRIVEREREADELTDMLIDGGFGNAEV